jgi:N-hydroxyarylamine O-acetyltransferase
MEDARFDLDAYLQRIGHHGERAPTLAVLRAVHQQHLLGIPFENLDILLGRPIRIDIASVQAKLVQAQRGGYCFEQNTLLAAALRALGFEVETLISRVRYRATSVRPRTHMMMLTHLDGQAWLCDVGFGSQGLLQPVPLQEAVEQQVGPWRYRLMREAGLWVLQVWEEQQWVEVYAFAREPQLPQDYELANYYTSTHPDSRFTVTLVAMRTTLERRFVLRNMELSINSGQGAVVARQLRDANELLDVLATTFGLPFAAGTRFRFGEISS